MTYNPEQNDDDADGVGNACDDLTVRFEASPRYGANPLTVYFDDVSEGNMTVTQWLWDFGDGFTSNSQFPAHQYATSGMFDVTLIISNSDGFADTATYEDFIYVADQLELLTFTEMPAFSAYEIRYLKTADMDFDNNLDLVLCDMRKTYLSIAYGNGDGTFSQPDSLLTSFFGFDFAFLNRDSLIDIVAASGNQIASLINQGNRNFFHLNS